MHAASAPYHGPHVVLTPAEGQAVCRLIMGSGQPGDNALLAAVKHKCDVARGTSPRFLEPAP